MLSSWEKRGRANTKGTKVNFVRSRTIFVRAWLRAWEVS